MNIGTKWKKEFRELSQDQKRTELKSIYFTKAELQKLKHLAVSSGLTEMQIGEYIRHKLLYDIG